jgi:ribulose-5-phosphate 4-epimerase/fuculose-1-phosphate aldolase
MPYATAITMLDNGRLEPASQEALRFYGDIAYDDSYNGLAHEPREGERIARQMGDKHVLFLAHHGVIVVGASVAQAFDRLYYLERASELQVKAMSCNRPLRQVPHDIAEKTAQQFGREREHWARLHLDALRRKLDCEHPDYAR